jgi:hypothetical protein
MSFLYDLADTTYKTAVFYQSGTWIKPRGITMISITAIGAGGGGGGGETGAVTVARFGGGGGGSGALTKLIIPEMFISDSLIINIGIGGVGGVSSGGSGGRGTDTFVDMPVRGNGDIYTRVITASGGTGGIRIAGAAGVAADVSQALYSTLGIWTAVAGQIGVAGLSGDGNIVVWGATGLNITSGAGGAGMAANGTTPTNGGQVSGSGFVPTNPGGLSGGNGSKGTFSLTPFYSVGGSGGGGGGTTPASGGNGGDGNIGCGGGGGGAGTTATGIGGTGGRGGNGLVIIQCW